MNNTKTLETVSTLMYERIKNMQQQDALDGKTHYTLQDYLLWALEEVTENDGVIVEIFKQ